MKLVKELGIEVSETIEVPEEHKEIVRERIKSEKSKDMVSWEKARKELVFKK